MRSLCLLLMIGWMGSRGLGGEPGSPVEFSGMCDASAVVAVDDDRFLVADDEDNSLRMYSLSRGGAAVGTFPMARFLGLQRKGSEADLEGAARVGDRVYWISSHGRNSKGKVQPARQRLFATTLGRRGTQVTLEPHGMPYTRLLDDLAALPELRSIGGRVGRRAEDSINIEALAATPGGELLIGFRSPVPQGQALIVPLLNPEEVVAGGRARLGRIVHLELGGLGIRDLVRWGDRYLILAGPPGSTGVFRLFEWTGGSAPVRGLDDIAFGDLRPEAITPWPDSTSDWWLVLSDDGSRLCDGVECKKLKDPTRKRFRARVVPAAPSLRPASPEISP